MCASRSFQKLAIFSFSILLVFEEVKNQNTNIDGTDINVDVKAIVDSNLDPKVIANILPYRTQTECKQINDAIAISKIGKPLVDPKYVPLMNINNNPYDDLLFALVNDPETVFSMYLGYYLASKNKPYVTTLFIQIDDRVKFKQTYDNQHDQNFDDAREALGHPFSNALKVWANDNRKDGPRDLDDACNQGSQLKQEQNQWNDGSRDRLESILMKHSIAYGQKALACYGNNYSAPKPSLGPDIKSTIIDTDLSNLYSSLVEYVQYDSTYLAKEIYLHCNESDKFTLWIVVLSTRRSPDLMKRLNDEFKAVYKGVTMKDYILVKNSVIHVDINADAKAIVDSKLNPTVIANILPYRTQDQCSKINAAIASLNGGKPLVDPKYVPLMNTKPYDDLLFALVNDPMTVFSMYLGHYLDLKNRTYVIMLFIQIDDRVKFKQIYNCQHDRDFDDARRAQGHPFSNALKVWAESNRVEGTGDSQDACGQGSVLKEDQDQWNDGSRDRLETILMKRTIPYGQRALRCYGCNYAVPKPELSPDIDSSIKNTDLASIYTSLASYIQNDAEYLAPKLHDHCDESDAFTMWIVILSTRRSSDLLKQLNEAFKAAYEGVSLKDFVLRCKSQDAVFLNMLAALSDPSYKPMKDD